MVWDLGSPARLLETIADNATDVVLMDLDLGLGPKQDGLTATRAVRNVHPEIRVVIVTAALDAGSVAASRAAGASGYLAKDLSATEMVAAVRTITAYGPIRKIFGSRHATSATNGGTTWSATRGLTMREQEVLTALNRGLTNREIASQFGVSVTTVNKHVQQVLKKLHVRNRSQAVARMHAETVTRAYQELDARS